MKGIRLLLLILVSVFGVNNTVLADSSKEACKVGLKLFTNLPSWYFKVTVFIDTPEGIKSGSAIWHEYWKKDSKSIVGYISKHEREAISIDIGKYGIVFALLKSAHGPNSQNLPFVSGRILPCELPQETKTRLDADKYIMNYVGHKQSVNFRNYPEIVRFNKYNGSDKIDFIYKKNEKLFQGTLDRFAEVFGQDVSLKEITVEIVDEPVDWKLQNYLPWIEDPNSLQYEKYKGYFRQGFEE